MASVAGALTLKQQLQLISLPSSQRTKTLKKIVKQIKQKSSKRATQQKNIDGTPFTPRKGRGRKKMLIGLKRRLAVSANPNRARVYFRGRETGRIAKAHHVGHTEIYRAPTSSGNTSNENATLGQARELKKLGYKRTKDSGRGKQIATIRWIRQNLSVAQAGLLLRLMNDSEAATQWKIKLPKRQFLGASEKEINTMIQTTFSEIMKSVKRVN